MSRNRFLAPLCPLAIVWLAASASLLFALPACAQYDSGTVLGSIKDLSGAIIPGSRVVLRNTAQDTVTERTSNAAGEFEFPSVLPGNYTLTTEHAGFKTTATAPFSVTVSARQRVDLVLAIGQADQSITVTDAASLLETDSSDRGEVVAARETSTFRLTGATRPTSPCWCPACASRCSKTSPAPAARLPTTSTA